MKLLITARDPVTAFDFLRLLECLNEDDRFVVHVAAQDPAIGIFRRKLSVSRIIFHEIETFACEDILRDRARILLKTLSPDAVLTGVSGPGWGIDEAVLAVVPRAQNSPYALQSYWGDINAKVGDRVSTYLVIDQFAAAVTKKRTAARIEVVGSPRHENYNAVDAKELRQIFRSKDRIRESSHVIGFYGQPLESVGGYKETVRLFLQSVSEMVDDIVLVYRPHPKESRSLRDWTISVVEDFRLSLSVDTEADVELSLCGCDLLVSAFSSCGFDAQQLIRRSSVPLGVPVYLSFNSDLTNWYRSESKLEMIPLTNNGMAVEIIDQTTMTKKLTEALKEEARELCWRAIKMNMEMTQNTASYITELVYDQHVTLCKD